MLAWGSCFGLLVVLKLVFASCEVEWHTGIRSPSGHAGLSTFVYGSWIRLIGRSPRWRGPLVLVGALLILAIATSRVVLHAHTGTEVLIGGAIGAAFLFAWRTLEPRLPVLQGAVLTRLLAATLIVQLIGQVVQIRAEHWVMQWGQQMHSAELCGRPVRAP